MISASDAHGYEIAVVGGGPPGLTTALYRARLGHAPVVIDPAGGPADATDPVDRVLERARDRGVAVRDARTFAGLDSHIRVAVRRPHGNDLLLDALRDR